MPPFLIPNQIQLKQRDECARLFTPAELTSKPISASQAPVLRGLPVLTSGAFLCLNYLKRPPWSYLLKT